MDLKVYIITSYDLEVLCLFKEVSSPIRSALRVHCSPLNMYVLDQEVREQDYKFLNEDGKKRIDGKMKNLCTLLSKVVSAGKYVEIFCCWEGFEEDPPLEVINVTLKDLQYLTFKPATLINVLRD